MRAEELIRDAYQELGKVAAEQPIKGSEFAVAVRYLNNLMYSKAYIITDYTVIENASDEITTPDVFNMWLVKALALKLAPQFGQVESYLAIKDGADDAWASVLIQLQRIPAPQLSSNVPLGSGNRSLGCSPKYYTETDNGVLSEQNANIAVEDDT